MKKRTFIWKYTITEKDVLKHLKKYKNHVNYHIPTDKEMDTILDTIDDRECFPDAHVTLLWEIMINVFLKDDSLNFDGVKTKKKKSIKNLT